MQDRDNLEAGILQNCARRGDLEHIREALHGCGVCVPCRRSSSESPPSLSSFCRDPGPGVRGEGGGSKQKSGSHTSETQRLFLQSWLPAR